MSAIRSLVCSIFGRKWEVIEIRPTMCSLTCLHPHRWGGPVLASDNWVLSLQVVSQSKFSHQTRSSKSILPFYVSSQSKKKKATFHFPFSRCSPCALQQALVIPAIIPPYIKAFLVDWFITQPLRFAARSPVKRTLFRIDPPSLLWLRDKN